MNILQNSDAFSEVLFEKMHSISAGIADLELYEFRYGLNEWLPPHGWETIRLDNPDEIVARLDCRKFYDDIEVKPLSANRVVLDPEIVRLVQMLFVGLVTEQYSIEWINTNFYFDIRGFYFLHRTEYFTDQVIAHFGGEPYWRFEQKQKTFDRLQDIGYKAFKAANAELDGFFIQSILEMIAARGTPILLAIAGPTAAGKTEIVERLRETVTHSGRKVTAIELDNFLTDRDAREAKGIHSQGKEAIHYELLKKALEDITHGKRISIPRYDFVFAASSHDLDGNLKAGSTPIEIEPAEVIFIEGNFPFLLEEIASLIGIKVVYLTDDPIRMKRKWKRDIDYRKKYDPTYFRNRYFKEQFIMAEIAYRPQMAICDLIVDTTGARLWATKEIKEILDRI
jgi:uridine kinase